MATSRARSADIKLIVSATVAVLLAGFLVAGGILVATRSKGSVVCGQLNIGSAADVRTQLETQGSGFNTGGADCAFWLALDNGDIVAYRVRQPSGCTLNLRDRGTRWECGGDTVAAADLAQYRVSIQTIGQTDSVIVDLVPPGLATTTTTTTA